MERTDVVCIGAGPAGLTAAYSLSKKAVPVVVLEQDAQFVGGISRTVEYKGYLFDIGGHRFFSKSKEVEALWDELLGDDMLERPRSSSIYYNRKFFSYPLKAQEALFNLGAIEASRCVLSYLKARALPVNDPDNFEDWVSNQFGKRLFNIFFKTYTEKVWGMKCREISADWAAQRIKDLSLWKAIYHAFVPQKESGKTDAVIKTLITTFRYPRRGPGMMWDAASKKTKEMGGDVRLGCEVTGLDYGRDSSAWTVTYCQDGTEYQIESRHVISSAPIRQLINLLTPHPADDVIESANALRYRDFLTVAVILKDRDRFRDNWIYIHDPDVRVGRIQNFKSWSPEMVPDPGTTCYGLEYFCFEGDPLWSSPDSVLIDLAKSELQKLELADPADVFDGCVVRQPKAYPVYDGEYVRHVDAIRHYLSAEFPDLHLVGRNGMHKYNNQDHAMMTALLTAENIAAGEPVFDVWKVNQDAFYHESGRAGDGGNESGLRLVPAPVSNEAA